MGLNIAFQIASFQVAAHTNCEIQLRECFLLQRPPCSALCRGLLRMTTFPKEDGLQLPQHNPKQPVSWLNAITTFQPLMTTGKPSSIILHAVCIPGAAYHTGFFGSEWSNIVPAGKNFCRLQLVGFLCKFNSFLLPDFWLINTEETT